MGGDEPPISARALRQSGRKSAVRPLPALQRDLSQAMNQARAEGVLDQPAGRPRLVSEGRETIPSSQPSSVIITGTGSERDPATGSQDSPEQVRGH